MHFGLLLLTCLSTICSSVAPKPPSFVKICNRNAPDMPSCMKESYKIIFGHGDKGIPEMNIRPFNPVIIESLSVAHGNGQAVTVDAKLHNIKLYGIPNTDLVDTKFDFNKRTYYCELLTPAIYLEADFTANGKVLLLQFDSKGVFRANMTGVHSTGTYQFESYQKNGKEHWKIRDNDFDVAIDTFLIDIENLFGDNKQLGESTNKAINENIDSLYDEMKPVILQTIKTVLNDAVSNVYNKYPLDVLFPV